ncbi:hypothetical protein B5M42_009850 [Paenibacillus athensensis]|uniref:Uncharacterized protein n=1 Tax=Paenibacillus athensensis TaxID=1967502 RepID=A0A4Y8PQ06_9BACL|nr:hypothetical protein [Paenibacillus athensensis]MCD1259141.1 hypothetical protein [Paenibacillus athensensis]
MISDEQLDALRVEGTFLRVVRDVNPENDVRGYVVAWDDESVLIRKRSRKVVKLRRSYVYQPYTEPRPAEFTLPAAGGELEQADGE